MGAHSSVPRLNRPTKAATALFSLLFVAGCLLAIVLGVWSAIENEAERRVAGRPPSAAERAKGVVRGLARIEANGKTPVPPCTASWKSGKSTRTTHFSGDNRVRFASGEEYALPETQKVEFFQNEGPARPNVPAGARAYLARIKPDVKSFSSIECLGPDEDVWVEACTDGERLFGCEKRERPVLLTVGGPDFRTTWLTSHAHGGIALALLGLAALAFFTSAALGHDRPVIASLARLRRVSADHGGLIGLMALSGFGVFVSICTWETTYGPWFLCAFVALLTIGGCGLAAARLRVLGVARRVLVDTATTRLDGERDLDRELAVHVAQDAPAVEGFRVGERHAVVEFEITEDYAVKSGSKTKVRTRDLTRGVHPRVVPIVDASGRGLLSFEHCTLDVLKEPELKWEDGMPRCPSWLAEVTGPLERSDTHRGYGVRWRVVQPGEPLLIYGGLERVMPTQLGMAEPGGYRVTPEVPLVRGHAHAPAVAYVGTESDLLRAIRVERVARFATLVLVPPAIVAAVVACAWVLQG